jgi:hypothetical protein
LSKRERRRRRDERGRDGSFQGFLPRHASPRADLSLREEMPLRNAPSWHRAPRHFPPSVEAGLRACGIGAYRLPGSSRSQWQGLESDAKAPVSGRWLIRPRHLPLRGQQRFWKDSGSWIQAGANPFESSI